MKKVVLILFLAILVSTSFVYSDGMNASHDEVRMLTEKGKVTEVITDVNPDNMDENNQSFDISAQVVKVEVLSGEYKGHEFLIENNLSGNRAYDIIVEEGDKVTLVIEETETGAPNIYISDFTRDIYIYGVLIAFAILILIVGRLKGLKSIVTLTITALVILKVMLPLFLKGYNPVWVTVLSAFFITFVTFIIIGGINIKSFSAIIGTLGGVLSAGTLAYIIGSAAKLTGLSNQEANMLMFIPQGIDFNFQGLLFAGIIIGALGAVMDVAMSVASSMYEIREINPDITPKELMQSGMNVGKDIMGTMSNTLILAYTGSSLPLLLVFMAYETELVKILNLDLIATEVIRSIVGSIGLIITIPITSLSTGLILKYRYKD